MPAMTLKHKISGVLATPSSTRDLPSRPTTTSLFRSGRTSAASSSRTGTSTPSTSSERESSSSSSPPPPPPDGPVVAVILQAWDAHDFSNSVSALAAWLNGRWYKTGYAVDAATLLGILRAHGRGEGARLGAAKGDDDGGLRGKFYRDRERRWSARVVAAVLSASRR
ncbi:hypothetical protein BDY21DRAFT_345748 [Lineolata rhizophorae]|uniref:Uncharacterized protein n=1 Tax=Lineolata rhizophorae TaxID=578093 RepID=A0A6A6NY41_9PEZI|nr:hypothetical protein BDY21DRAFT_345748 [Lineolata rhizophorae]